MKQRHPKPAISSWVRYQRRATRKEAWRYWSQTLWRTYRWLLLSMVSPAVMIAMGRIYAGEPGSDIVVWTGVVMLGFVLCVGIGAFLRIWRFHISTRLYFQDIADGACADRGLQISFANGQKWYRKNGAPLWLSSKRERP